MFRRFFIILIEIGAVCVLLSAAGLFWASYYIDTDEFRVRFIDTIKEFTGRNVKLYGELDISLWPGFVLEVEDLSVDESPEFGNEPFVHFDRIRVSVRLIPLISERLDIRSVMVEGMELSIVQNNDGLFNWQSIVDKNRGESLPDSPSGFAIKEVTLSGLEVINASVKYKDDTGKNGYLLSGVNLRTGAIDPGESVPFTASSAFSWVDGGVESDLTLKGMIEAGFDGAPITLKDATLYASVGGAFLPVGANPGEMTARVVVDWDKRSVALDGLRARFLGLRAEGNIASGDLSEGFSTTGHVTVHPFKPADIIARYFPKAPVKSVDGLRTSSFTSFFQVDESGIKFKDLALALDEMTIRGWLGFKGYSKPNFSFDLRGNTIDLDPYLPLFKTDTPFIWDDFMLGTFRAFRGQGTVRADGFNVLETLVSDIRLSIKADKKSILIDAGAIKKGQASLGGRTEVSIGKSSSTGEPVLKVSAHLTAESQKGGFAFLKTTPLSLGGKGSLDVKANVTQMVCPSSEPSIDIMRHLEGNVSLSLGEGSARYKGKSANPVILDYSKVNISLGVTPAKMAVEDYYSYTVAANVRMRGGKDIETVTVAGNGALTTAIDKLHVKSSGMDVKGHMTSTLLPSKAKRITASGRVSFDSETGKAFVTGGNMHLLNTSIKGTANISGLDKDIKASGMIEVPDANPKRIIYLLSGFAANTNDAEALKKASLSTRYKVDKNGFTLSELEGGLDGMPVNGHIVGQGLKNPMLSFSFAAGAFDLDKYLPPSQKVSLEERRSGKVKKAPPVDLPLGFLRALRLNGKGSFEEFKLAGIRANDVTANVKADRGKIHVFDVKGAVHKGKLTTDWTGDVRKNELMTHLQLHIEDMQAGPLLKDLSDRDYVRGETDVDFDLISTGATDDEILKYLRGKAWVRIRNGSFKFTGYDSPPPRKGNVTDTGANIEVKPRPRTTFHKAMAYFSVDKGVFSVDKFRVEAPPLLQSYGQGSFSLPDNTVNMSVRNDFVAVPSVTIQVVGKLTDPEVKVPKGKIVDDTVRNILSLPEKSFEFLRDLFN